MLNKTEETQFLNGYRCVEEEVYKNAFNHGFFDGGLNFKGFIADIHSEISEAYFAHRDGNPMSQNIPNFSCVEEELGDIIQRIMSKSFDLGLDVAGAIIEKMKYNSNRPYKHGKEF